MTVKELIKHLKKYPQNVEVLIGNQVGGIDCSLKEVHGTCSGPSYDTISKVVLVRKKLQIMGELADDIIDGACCALCGIYFEEEHGYPVACKCCHEDPDCTYPEATEEEI